MRLSNAARECNYSSRASNWLSAVRAALVLPADIYICKCVQCTCARTLPARDLWPRQGCWAEHPAAAHSLFNTALDDSVTNLWREARCADVKNLLWYVLNGNFFISPLSRSCLVALDLHIANFSIFIFLLTSFHLKWSCFITSNRI